MKSIRKTRKTRKTKLIYGGEKNGDTAINDARKIYKKYIGNARKELDNDNIKAAIDNLNEYLDEYLKKYKKEDTEIRNINDLLKDSQIYIEKASGKIEEIATIMDL